MLIAAVADLHGHLIDTPECDVLVIAGDVCPLTNHSSDYQAGWLRGEFSTWLRAQPARHIVGIAGNHDLVTESHLEVAPELPWTYLLNEATAINDVIFWGSPMAPWFGSWAWMTYDNNLQSVWRKIPDNTDVLITHSPPYGGRDRTYNDEAVGSQTLRWRVKEVQPLLHIFGHIHPAYGVDAIFHGDGNRTVVANASIVNGVYRPVNLPLQFRLNMRTRQVEHIST